MSKENNLNEKTLQVTGKSLVFETLGSITEMQKTTDSKTGLMKLTGTFGVCGVVNNNNRIYEKNNYAAMVKELQKEITEKGGIPGELEHPQTMNISLENVSHKITDISIDENGLVTGTIELLNTPKGKIAQSIVEGGLPLFVSSRATGEIKESKVTLSKIYTYDLVGTPGFSQARVHLNENQNVTELNESIYVITEKDNSNNNNNKNNHIGMKNNIIKNKNPFINEDREEDIELLKLGVKIREYIRSLDNQDFPNINYYIIKNNEYVDLEEALKNAIEKSKGDWPLLYFATGKNKTNNDSLGIILDPDMEEYDGKILGFDYNEFIKTNNSFKKYSNIQFVSFNPDSKKEIEIEFIGLQPEDIFKKTGTSFSFGEGVYFDGNLVYENEYNPSEPTLTKQEILNLIQEAINKSEKNQENYILDVLAPTLESWLTKDYAKVLEAWLEDEYSKKIQQITEDYVINEAAPVIEKWIIEQYSGELEKWVVENVVGILDKYINEQLTPGILEQAKKEINESLKSNKESKIGNIKEMLTMLEGISGGNGNQQGNKGNNQFKPATNAINENGSNVTTEPIYIQNMPDHIRPKYINLSESVKEIIATKAKLFNFNVPGSIERFWSDFDNMVEKYSCSKGNNNGNLNENYQGKYNSGLTLNNYENTIREQLRQRFAKYNK